MDNENHNGMRTRSEELKGLEDIAADITNEQRDWLKNELHIVAEIPKTKWRFSKPIAYFLFVGGIAFWLYAIWFLAAYFMEIK